MENSGWEKVNTLLQLTLLIKFDKEEIIKINTNNYSNNKDHIVQS
jgi:hypothetical protein